MKKAKRKRSPVPKRLASGTRVMVFGVFDLLHPGHISFLRQAKKLPARRSLGEGGGNFLVVSVARDVNVKKVKGYKSQQSEEVRMNNLKRLQFVDRVVLGGQQNPWPHIRKETPDLIALGYDQKPYVDLKELKKIAKVVRLKAFKPKIFKSSKLKQS
ncbi:MAG: adenylyltransferase/cytidyltransferase family protein [Candidatus Doudnabacteria bacterium]|nr:adenylyltransferase/cytidyltransferase family protein [Candidatus Doudnabacteria bacterium]